MSVRLMSMVFENQELDSTEKLIMLALADHANDEGKSIYPSQITISRKTGLARQTINKHIQELIEKNYLVSMGYKIDRSNVLELAINISTLIDKSGVTEDDIGCHLERQGVSSRATGGVTEDDSNHHLTINESSSKQKEDMFKDTRNKNKSPHSLALTDDNGELIPEEDRIIEIFCDRVGLRGNARPYEGDPSNRKWYADWLKEAGEIQKLNISSGEMGEAIAILKSSNYPCKHPSAIIETVKNMRKDRELFEKGEKKKLHRFKLQKYTEADGDWNYQPIDWWEEK